MLRFPVMPVSCWVSRDFDDVFMSFHFEATPAIDANLLSLALISWLREFLIQQGIEAIEFDEDGNDVTKS